MVATPSESVRLFGTEEKVEPPVMLKAGDLTSTKDQNPWANWAQIPAYTGGLIWELISDGHPKVVTDLNVRNDPALGDAEVADRPLVRREQDRRLIRDPEGGVAVVGAADVVIVVSGHVPEHRA